MKLSFMSFHRASKSLTSDVPGAKHELTLSTTFCQQAYTRVQTNLKSLTDGTELNVDQAMSTISQDITNNGGVVTTHPLKI